MYKSSYDAIQYESLTWTEKLSVVSLIYSTWPKSKKCKKNKLKQSNASAQLLLSLLFRFKDASPVEVHASAARRHRLQPSVYSLGEQGRGSV